MPSQFRGRVSGVAAVVTNTLTYHQNKLKHAQNDLFKSQTKKTQDKLLVNVVCDHGEDGVPTGQNLVFMWNYPRKYKTITLRILYHLKLAPTHLLMPESGKAALCACALHLIARASPCSFVWSPCSIAMSFQPPGCIVWSGWVVHQYFIKRKRFGTTWFASLWSVNSCTAYAEWSLKPGNANVVLASTRDRGLIVSNRDTLHNGVLGGGSLHIDLSRPVRACDMMNACSTFGPSKSSEAIRRYSSLPERVFSRPAT